MAQNDFETLIEAARDTRMFVYESRDKAGTYFIKERPRPLRASKQGIF
jgi:hypothetical protein